MEIPEQSCLDSFHPHLWDRLRSSVCVWGGVGLRKDFLDKVHHDCWMLRRCDRDQQGKPGSVSLISLNVDLVPSPPL